MLVSPSDSPLDKAKKLYDVVQKIENTDSSPDGAPLTGSEWIPRGKVESVLLKQERIEQPDRVSLPGADADGGNQRTSGADCEPQSSHLFSAIHGQRSARYRSRRAARSTGKRFLSIRERRWLLSQTLHWAHAGAGGVAMDASNKAEIIVTPLQKNTDNSTLHVGTLNVSPQGAVSGTLKVAFIGQKAIELRQLGVKSGVEAVKVGDQRNARAAGAGGRPGFGRSHRVSR